MKLWLALRRARMWMMAMQCWVSEWAFMRIRKGTIVPIVHNMKQPQNIHRATWIISNSVTIFGYFNGQRTLLTMTEPPSSVTGTIKCKVLNMHHLQWMHYTFAMEWFCGQDGRKLGVWMLQLVDSETIRQVVKVVLIAFNVRFRNSS